MKIIIRIVLAALAVILLLAILSVTPYGQGIFGGDAARQACLDHMADQAAKGQPITYKERFAQWSKLENRNLYAEPELFNHLTKYEDGTEEERQTLLEAATKRLLKGMENCDTVSMVPIGVEAMKTDAIYLENPRTRKVLWDNAMKVIDQMITDGHPDHATQALINLHEIFAHWNDHFVGTVDSVVHSMLTQTLYIHTLDLLHSGKIHPTTDQLAQMRSLAHASDRLDAWPNALLFERGFLAGMMDNATGTSHIPWWKVHRRFRYSETIYKAILESWRAMEIAADLPPSSQITLDDITAAQSKAAAYANSPALSRPNRFLDAEWQLIRYQSFDWADGLKITSLRHDAYLALLAAHQIKSSSGTFPSSLEEIPHDLLPSENAKRLKEAKTQLHMEDNKPPYLTFEMPDSSVMTYPPEEEPVEE